MTKVYFIRHAESDTSVRDERLRPLTEKGLRDCVLVTDFLWDKEINAVLSSPFIRSVDTVADFARLAGIEIEIIEDFRERKNVWRDDFASFAEKQWMDFSYTEAGNENLKDTQGRNIVALNNALKRFGGKNIVIGTHGTALSVIINYYDNTYSFDDFMAMVSIMPWIVVMEFDDTCCMNIEKINLFDRRQGMV